MFNVLRNTRWHAPRQRAALSLLEVILALAILAGALAVISELVRTGATGATNARDTTTAQLLCEAKLEQLNAGLLLPQTISEAAVEEDLSGIWMYSIYVEPLGDQGLLLVTVTVYQDPQQFVRPLSFSLTRWMVDPELQIMIDEQMAAAASASSSSSTGSSF